MRFAPMAGFTNSPSRPANSTYFTAPGVMAPLGGAAPAFDESREPVYNAISGGVWKLIISVPSAAVTVPWIWPAGTNTLCPAWKRCRESPCRRSACPAKITIVSSELSCTCCENSCPATVGE